MKYSITGFFDAIWGILKRCFNFMKAYILLAGAVFMILIAPTGFTNSILHFLFGQQVLSVTDFLDFMKNGTFFDYMINLYMFQSVIVILFKIAKISFSMCGRKFDKITDILEIVSAYGIISCYNSFRTDISIDSVIVVAIAYYLIGFIYKKVVIKCNLESKHFKKGCCKAPLGKATIGSEVPKEDKAEELADENENAEHQTLTVQKLIDKLGKVEEMDVSVRYGSVIVDATDVFECESDGVPFMCIDCAEVKKSE